MHFETWRVTLFLVTYHLLVRVHISKPQSFTDLDDDDDDGDDDDDDLSLVKAVDSRPSNTTW